MLDKDGYPTDELLKSIESWDWKDVKGFFQLIKYYWHFGDWGYNEKEGVNDLDRPVMKVELHTGGWSGNEDIVRVAKCNRAWGFWWRKSERGGHYYFEIPLKIWRKEDK